ncbi:MAG: Vi polysaccharide biosynthesis UDP-N-acetylglucosamine C-6 dehydrogenase TviB, partial [Chitinophagaceae bacterium]|nr:Vi polysaccharide biosynthesis UDP-N-acetylglucosamine C-6 dehydrogenase TviB [Chitinophagaceae bacterium]
EVILSGRRVNDNMGLFVASKVVKLMITKGQKVKGAKALILGITFKENCPDIRNTKVVDIYNELKQYGMKVDIYDPHANNDEVHEEFGINIIDAINSKYNALILAVSHNEFINIDVKKITEKDAVIFDTKAFLDREIVDARL